MKFYKKTSYGEDVRLFRDWPMAFWYALLILALLTAPAILPAYYLTQLVLIGIYVVAGAGLMLLCGYCGQISLGHSAFFAVGAFTTAVLENLGIPFPLAFLAAGMLGAGVGVVIGFPALRLSGMYLAIATLAAAFIVTEVIVRWESVTKGASGIVVPRIKLATLVIDSQTKFYFIVLTVAVLAMLAVRNIMRSPLGLAMMAIRDSETAAQSMGVPLMRTKVVAFTISALLTSFAGALYAHAIQFIDPDQFSIFLSIEFLVMVFIGGIGSMHGIVLGAVFVIALPQGVAVLKDFLPPAIAQQTGLQAAVYALVLLGFILVEPTGLYGIWRKIKHYFSMFPFYRKGSLKRSRSFAKSETW
ncbi:MAG: branched-chain amino acid ABC transporter permease [Betaproteobacteria bacterium]|jgi:branched-chain amino acid transport system permease protein